MPYFSIIIPMYNRAGYIGRALDSCLSQDFIDFEVIVVDDGSRDGSADVVRQYNDPRIRLICHERNRGRCPARNTAMEAASGQWYVFLDSDDELTPGALTRIHRFVKSLSSDVGSIKFMCRSPEGQPSPDPPLEDKVWTYEDYVRWTEQMHDRASETLPCVKAASFPRVRYPEDHAQEAIYHLELARLYLVASSSEVVRIYHQDAENQVTKPNSGHSLLWANSEVANVGSILSTHGQALRLWAPRRYRELLRAGAVANFLSGRRIAGLRYWCLALYNNPLSILLLGVCFFGLLGPKSLAWAKAIRERHRRRGL